jgi:acetone carboxylase gamma subunit
MRVRTRMRTKWECEECERECETECECERKCKLKGEVNVNSGPEMVLKMVPKWSISGPKVCRTTRWYCAVCSVLLHCMSPFFPVQ